MSRRTNAATAALGALFLLAGAAGCSDDASGGRDPASDESSPADEGPECVGDADSAASGTRVLRGGEATLPGGGTVSYEEAEADGTTRRAGLSEGGMLGLDEQVTVQGATYTVTQICAYRVVLTSDDPALTPEPVAEPDWPTTQDGSWTLNAGITDSRPDPPLTVALGSINDELDISVRTESVVIAHYDDVAAGQTVEIADQLWKVAEVDPGTPDADMADDDYEAASVRLKLLGPAVGAG